jgi:hypothetical protein
MSASRGSKAVGMLLFLGWSLLVTVALLEVGVRLFAPQPLPQSDLEIYRPAAEIGWRRNPNVRAVASVGEHDVDICTDAAADRVDCDAPPRDPGSCKGRILVLGDSFVEALAVPFRDTVWSRIERETGACLSVAGVGGYWPQQYARQLEERLAQGGPPFDLVILDFYAGNDFTTSADFMPGPEEVTRPQVHWLPAGLSPKELWNWLYPMNEWLEARSHLYVASRYAALRLIGFDDVRRYGVPVALLRSGLTERHVVETTRVVERIAHDAEAAGVPLLVVVIPLQNQVLDPKAESLASRFPALREDLDMELVSQRFVPRIGKLVGVGQVVDLLPYLRAHADESAWDRRDRHFSARGHALWFEAIRQPVDDVLAKR